MPYLSPNKIFLIHKYIKILPNWRKWVFVYFYFIGSIDVKLNIDIPIL
jgi:hypothetical protein